MPIMGEQKKPHKSEAKCKDEKVGFKLTYIELFQSNLQ